MVLLKCANEGKHNVSGRWAVGRPSRPGPLVLLLVLFIPLLSESSLSSFHPCGQLKQEQVLDFVLFLVLFLVLFYFLGSLDFLAWKKNVK